MKDSSVKKEKVEGA
jgi:hypothetical protein